MAELSCEASELRRVVEAIRQRRFTEADTERLLDSGRDATTFVLL